MSEKSISDLECILYMANCTVRNVWRHVHMCLLRHHKRTMIHKLGSSSYRSCSIYISQTGCSSRKMWGDMHTKNIRRMLFSACWTWSSNRSIVDYFGIVRKCHLEQQMQKSLAPQKANICKNGYVCEVQQPSHEDVSLHVHLVLVLTVLLSCSPTTC